MGRKKSFIDKKTSATFRLVCRDSSASDPLGFSTSSDKVFTRVDSGTNYVPGFTDEDPITTQQSTDSIFADAEEVDDVSDEESHARSVGASLSIPKRDNNSYIADRGPLSDHVRREILELGLPDDGYNYLLHLREIRVSGGGSAFVPNPKANLSSLPSDVKAYDASKLQVQAREEDDTSSNALYALGSRIRHVRNVQKAADPEVLAHLEKSDGSEFDSDEVLDEDFVIQANKPEEEVEGESSMRTPETRQEYLQGIQPSTGQDNHAASSSKNCFDAALQIPTDDTENGALQGGEKQRIPRLLDEQFEMLALREYSDGEYDASDDFDCEMMGAVDIHAPEIDHAMKEFLTNNLDFQDKYTVPGDLRSHANTESSNKNQKGAKLDSYDFPESEFQKTVEDVIRKCAEYAEMYENESQEEKEVVLVEESSSDGEVWDCETIVSTYSNLDNHPAKIGAPQKPSKKNISEFSSRNKEMHKAVIPLRGRQQIPVDFLPKTKNSRKKEVKSKSEIDSKNVAQVRVEETLEQKKARKAAVKEEKRGARRSKKELKGLYRGESQRAQHVAAVAGPPGIHLM